jgi:dipeptidase E
VAIERHIIGQGGGGQTPEQTQLLSDYVFDVVGKPRPKLMYVPTAIAEDPEGFAMFHDRWGRRADLTHLRTFPWPPRDLRDLVLEQDGISVSGGNTANMLAIWRVHGIDELFRDAWERGVVFWGASAGMICWFEQGVTDSFGPQLEGMDCLGFLPGSACPHYDGEEQRRPRYRELIDGGFKEGIAADDGVAVHYVGTEISEIVACRPGAAAYRVTREGEERLQTKELR